MATEGPGTPADPVHADPLAAARAIRARALDGDLEHVAADPTLHSSQIVSPADQLTVGGRPVGAPPTEQGDGLEQARLAGGVRSPDQVRAGRERDLEPGVSAQVEDRERVE